MREELKAFNLKGTRTKILQERFRDERKREKDGGMKSHIHLSIASERDLSSYRLINRPA